MSFLPSIRLLAVLVALPLAGCVSTSTSFIEEPEPPVAESLPPPLAYYVWLKQASQQELVAERDRLFANEIGEDPFMVALRHGLLLLATGVMNGQREADVLKGLADASEAEHPDEIRALGQLVGTQIRLRRQVLGVNQPQNEGTTAELERLREENARLQRQIDALTSIEQQLIEREINEAQKTRQP